jgi:hypothetical protein
LVPASKGDVHKQRTQSLFLLCIAMEAELEVYRDRFVDRRTNLTREVNVGKVLIEVGLGTFGSHMKDVLMYALIGTFEGAG